MCSPDGKLPDGTKCEPPCPYGVTVPGRDVNQAEVETYWLRDRKGLKTCRTTHEATIKFYEELRNSLSRPED